MKSDPLDYQEFTNKVSEYSKAVEKLEEYRARLKEVKSLDNRILFNNQLELVRYLFKEQEEAFKKLMEHPD